MWAHALQVPEEEEGGDGEAQANEDVVQNCCLTLTLTVGCLVHPEELTRDRRPRNQGHWYPDDVRVAVQSPALEQICRLAAKPLQRGPEGNWNEAFNTISPA